MIEIHISGGSDDLIEVDVRPSEGSEHKARFLTEEYQHYKGAWRAQIAGAEYGSLIVVAQYDAVPGTGWRLGIEQDIGDGDSAPLPAWPITIQQHPETEYSPELIITAPDNTTIRILTP